ncbi:hypothetical protein PR259_03170, partial [Metamycoplasma hyosynoviae]
KIMFKSGKICEISSLYFFVKLKSHFLLELSNKNKISNKKQNQTRLLVDFVFLYKLVFCLTPKFWTEKK